MIEHGLFLTCVHLQLDVQVSLSFAIVHDVKLVFEDSTCGDDPETHIQSRDIDLAIFAAADVICKPS